MDERLWDSALQRLGGNLLQSRRWGDFKELQGWNVRRICEESSLATWTAQILFKPLGPFSIAYVPCGPTMAGDYAVAFSRMMTAIDAVCRQHRAITLIMEPDQRFDIPGTYREYGFVQWTNPFQPRTTMSIPIDDDQSMLARMHHKTRYHIRLAQRQGAVIEPRPASQKAIEEFHALYAETVARNGLTLLPVDYFKDLLSAFGDQAELLFAMIDGRPAAAALLARFADEATYLFAGSSKQNRGQGAGAFLVFGSLQWARERSCRSLDLGSISSQGLRDFKSGFGGVVHSYPPAMERRYRPLMAWGARRMLGLRRI